MRLDISLEHQFFSTIYCVLKHGIIQYTGITQDAYAVTIPSGFMNNYALQTDLAHRHKEMAKGFSLTIRADDGSTVLQTNFDHIHQAFQRLIDWSIEAVGQDVCAIIRSVQCLRGVGNRHVRTRPETAGGVLAYTFARIGVVVNLKVEDYYPSGKRFLLRFKEKGGKEKDLPGHHKLEG